MRELKDLGRDLRGLWLTLAAICLIGAGAAYGATWYVQGELEDDATRQSRRLAVDVLEPLLSPTDGHGPIRGARYELLLATIREQVLTGPTHGVRLWKADGTILFAGDSSLVGRKVAEMRKHLRDAIGDSPLGFVDGRRFRTLTTLRSGEPETLVVAELIRSHTAIIEASRERWYPWVGRALSAAAVFGALAVVTAIVFALVGQLKRHVDRRKARTRPSPPVPTRRSGAGDEGLPAYMAPGFQQEVEARERVEAELAAAQRERDDLSERLRRLEHEGQEPAEPTPLRGVSSSAT